MDPTQQPLSLSWTTIVSYICDRMCEKGPLRSNVNIWVRDKIARNQPIHSIADYCIIGTYCQCVHKYNYTLHSVSEQCSNTGKICARGLICVHCSPLCADVTVTFSPQNYTVTEGDPAPLMIILDKPAAKDITVTVTTMDITATGEQANCSCRK